MPELKEILAIYVPEAGLDMAAGWICTYRIHLKITRNRRSKFGDYRTPTPRFQFHRITINHNLNHFAFIITLAHEVAHLKQWLKDKNFTEPHGVLWKHEFRILLEEMIRGHVFPDKLVPSVLQYANNIKASSCSDEDLFRALKGFDIGTAGSSFLEDIPENAPFLLLDGRRFIKGEKLRKRYKCLCTDNRRTYYVSAVAEVILANT